MVFSNERRRADLSNPVIVNFTLKEIKSEQIPAYTEYKKCRNFWAHNSAAKKIFDNAITKIETPCNVLIISDENWRQRKNKISHTGFEKPESAVEYFQEKTRFISLKNNYGADFIDALKTEDTFNLARELINLPLARAFDSLKKFTARAQNEIIFYKTGGT